MFKGSFVAIAEAVAVRFAPPAAAVVRKEDTDMLKDAEVAANAAVSNNDSNDGVFVTTRRATPIKGLSKPALPAADS